MKTVSINLYSYSELSLEAQAAARDHFRTFNTEHEWSSHILETWEEKLEHLGYSNIDFNFSGFCSQGDGASFTADFDSVSYARTNPDSFPLLSKLSKLDELIVESRFIRIDSHYVHENSVSFNLDIDVQLENALIAEQNKEQYNQEIIKLENEISHNARKLMREIYKELESEYDHLTSDKAVAEALEANDHILFTVDGKYYKSN